jgi:hypothetical protein
VDRLDGLTLMFLARLRRHPIAIEANLRRAITLTYALPEDCLRPLLPPGLTLDTHRGSGFLAAAIVETESLRPSGFPQTLGQDFFLAGYRVFTTLDVGHGRRLRGLRILRSDANRRRMVVGGNLLTHYNYHLCRTVIDVHPERIDVSVDTPDGGGDLDLTVFPGRADVPPGSPFGSVREARRFAGPLPYTFDYEAETGAIVAINATRTNWRPSPVAVEIRRIGFFDRPQFEGCTPTLAAAFMVTNVEYRWHRGVLHPLGADVGRGAA